MSSTADQQWAEAIADQKFEDVSAFDLVLEELFEGDVDDSTLVFEVIK